MDLSLKRLFDLTVSTFLLFSIWPALLLVAILVLLTLGRPILFKQERLGINGEPFRLVKFRTLSNETDEAGQLLPDSMRLSKFGSLLRSTSLDELPELWNVLRGDMSLVGPRPLLVEYLKFYTKKQARRHSVLPGITGWAQVNGRNSQSWEERFDLDVWYVENHSLSLDMKILWKTIFVVVKREGVSGEGVATMSKYDGNKQ